MSEPMVVKSDGVTVAERYLQGLCERSFLSLWSYAGVFNDRGKTGSGDGKEVCDLLVIFGNDIIIFSDKNCKFLRTAKLDVAWTRWFKTAVLASAIQVFGAERWIRDFPDRLFLDRSCTKPFPLQVPNSKEARFHRIVVAHNSAPQCREELGGSGSLAICPRIVGRQHYENSEAGILPFTIGWVGDVGDFVHVLDDISLDILLETLDTITDFVAYLRKKEDFIASGRLLHAAGEEELLATYLADINADGEHDFIFAGDADGVVLAEGLWENFHNSSQRRAQIREDKISYAWDDLIETFSKHAFEGTQYYVSPSGFAGTEKCLRLMAREGRTRRRMLADAFVGLVVKTGDRRIRATRVLQAAVPGDAYYVFLLLPELPGVPNELYRETRRHMLEALCMIVRLKFPDAKDIVGLATETGISESRSEDALYFDGRNWGLNEAAEAERLQRETKLLTNTTEYRDVVKEYPDPWLASDGRVPFSVSPNPRNKPYPCGSGKKYKKCHGK